MTIPIIDSSTVIAMNMSTATMLMANAFSHPQSKKCFTKASQITSIMIEAIIPVKK
jgi:hypothetical protein